jgi:hypothetical protein
MRDPILDDLENDPDLRSLLSDIEDEYFLIQDDESENDEESDDEDDDDEDVVARLTRGNRGEWHDEYN